MQKMVGQTLRAVVPVSVRALVPVRVKAWARAALGIEPWPDLSIRHSLFRSPEFQSLRRRAEPFDRFRKPYKPPIERGHQASFLVTRCFADAGVRSAFHVGFSNGRYLFYLEALGVEAGGIELPVSEAPENQVPEGVFDRRVLDRMLRLDFFELAPDRVRKIWDRPSIDVMFTEATFETLFPWRREGFSVLKYRQSDAEARRRLLEERLPAQLAALAPCVRNMIFIEPEPDAGGARAVFERCARALPRFAYSVWRFRPPFDRLFRLSPTEPVVQAVYAYSTDSRLLEPLAAYADRE